MKKEEFTKRYGEAAWEKRLQQWREWKKTNPKKVKAQSQQQCRKGGRHYEQHYEHKMKGIPHARHLIRQRHGQRWRSFKKIIAPESQIHHEWLPKTANYRGVALVEKDQHQHGYIDVIQILEGEITLLTEVRKGGF